MSEREPGDGAFARQFALEQRDYLAHIDFYTWTRHYHLFKDVANRPPGDVLEIGAGDGILRRCLQPFVRSYTVMDINPRLEPQVLGDVARREESLVGRFDVVVAAEVLEHLPFDRFDACIGNLRAYLRPDASLFLTLPHRKAHLMLATPRQRMWFWRLPIGLTSVSEAWHRFVRRRIWIDPHHRWEIGDGLVRRRDVEAVLRRHGLETTHRVALPYCDYWVLAAPR